MFDMLAAEAALKYRCDTCLKIQTRDACQTIHSWSANAAAALYEAPSDMSKANGMLAEALGVKRSPILQVCICSSSCMSLSAPNHVVLMYLSPSVACLDMQQ